MKLIIVMAWMMITTIAITKTTSCAQSTPTSFDRFDSFSESITFKFITDSLSICIAFCIFRLFPLIITISTLNFSKNDSYVWNLKSWVFFIQVKEEMKTPIFILSIYQFLTNNEEKSPFFVFISFAQPMKSTSSFLIPIDFIQRYLHSLHTTIQYIKLSICLISISFFVDHGYSSSSFLLCYHCFIPNMPSKHRSCLCSESEVSQYPTLWWPCSLSSLLFWSSSWSRLSIHLSEYHSPRYGCSFPILICFRCCRYSQYALPETTSLWFYFPTLRSDAHWLSR